MNILTDKSAMRDWPVIVLLSIFIFLAIFSGLFLPTQKQKSIYAEAKVLFLPPQKKAIAKKIETNFIIEPKTVKADKKRVILPDKKKSAPVFRKIEISTPATMPINEIVPATFEAENMVQVSIVSDPLYPVSKFFLQHWPSEKIEFFEDGRRPLINVKLMTGETVCINLYNDELGWVFSDYKKNCEIDALGRCQVQTLARWPFQFDAQLPDPVQTRIIDMTVFPESSTTTIATSYPQYCVVFKIDHN